MAFDSSIKFTGMANCCAVDSLSRQRCFSGQKSCSNSVLNCRRGNASTDSSCSDSSQCLVIEPWHCRDAMDPTRTCNSNSAVVFSDLPSCATKSSHSADTTCSSSRGRAACVLDRTGDGSPFPRFPHDSNFNHRPESLYSQQQLRANRSPMQEIYHDDLETAGHNSEYQWWQHQQQQQQQLQQYWQPLQQSNRYQQPRKPHQGPHCRSVQPHPLQCQAQKQQRQPLQQHPTQRRPPPSTQKIAGAAEGIYSPARARNTTVHRVKQPPCQNDMSFEESAMTPRQPKQQKPVKWQQQQLRQKPKPKLPVPAESRQKAAASPAAPRCARCPSKPRPCPMKQRRHLRRKQTRLRRRRQQQMADCVPGEASCGDCQPPRIVLCPAKQGREKFSRVKLQTQPGRFITRQVLFFDGTNLYKPEQPRCPCF